VYLVLTASFLVKEFSVLNFEAKCLSGVIFVMISRYLGREEIWCVEPFYAPFKPQWDILDTTCKLLTAILIETLYYHIPSIRNGDAA